MPDVSQKPPAPPAGAKPPRWRRRAGSRPGEIAAAGLRLFCERGYAGVSVDDIAREAGVTKGAVYHHFAGKEDLLAAALEFYYRRAFEEGAVAVPAPPHDTAVRRVEAFLWGAWRLWHSPEFLGIFRLLLGGGAAEVPVVLERFLKEGPHRGWSALADLIKAGQGSGEFRKGVDPARSARLIASGLVIPIVFASLGGAPRRPSKMEFNRQFKLVIAMLSA